MSFSHLYYTSSRTGVYNGLGFQVYTMAKDITEGEKAEIIRYGSYKAPEQLSAYIDEQSIATLYPKSFSFYPLASGRMALTAVRYIGKDYSNRNGNYFSDTAVFELPALDARAIEYFESPDFKSGLTAQEEEGLESPTFLQPAAHLQRGTAITRKKVIEFIQQANHAEVLGHMLEAVMEHAQTHKKIVILDEPLYVAYWIAAVHYCFPTRLASTLSFTTYTEDPLYSPAMLCGVYSEALPPSSWAFDFAMFNTKDHQYPQFNLSAYTKLLIQRLLENPAELDELLEFVDLVAAPTITKALNDVLPLYQLLHQPVNKLSLEELNKALAIYLKMNNPQALQMMTKQLTSSWLHSDFTFMSALQNDVISALSYKLIEVAATLDDETEQLATKFFLESWLHLVASAKQEHEFTARRMYLTTVIESTAHNKLFHEAALEESHLSRVYDLFIAQPSEGLWNELIFATFAHINAAGASLDDEGLKRHLLFMLDLAVKQQFKLDAVYDIILRNDQYFFHTIRLSLEAYEKNEEKRNYLLNTMLKFVELRPELHLFMRELAQSNAKVEQYMIMQYEQKIATAEKPISLIARVVTEDMYMKWTPEHQEAFFAVAADNLLAKREPDLAELQLLWDNRSWVELLQPHTHMSLMQQTCDYLLGTAVEKYELLLTKWLAFSEELDKKVPLLHLLLILVKIEKEKALTEDKLLILQQTIQPLTALQKERLLITRMGILLAATEKDKKAQAIVLEMVVKYCKPAFLKNFQKRALSEQMVQQIASYYDYLIKHNVALDEQDKAFFHDVRGLKKSLKDLFKQQKFLAYESLEQQAKGKQASIFTKIIPKNLFKKGDK